MIEFDLGPPAAVAAHLAQVPKLRRSPQVLLVRLGPIFYRGRLDKSTKGAVHRLRPGPTERIAGRTLVGDAGQGLEGFLTKLGLTRSYSCVNAFVYALLPSAAQKATPILFEPEQLTWRNTLLSMIVGPKLQAIVAFGVQAHRAIDLWEEVPNVPITKVPHPSSRDAGRLINEWRAAVGELRAAVTPDPGIDPLAPNYGTRFSETDYAAIPARDLPFGVPPWLGRRRVGTQCKAPSQQVHGTTWHCCPPHPDLDRRPHDQP